MRIRFAALIVAVTAVAAGCGYHTITPQGAAPMRYRDPVFSAVTVTKGVTYGSAVDQLGAPTTLKLDVYAPTGDTNTSRPAIVWVHGGSFSGGNETSPEIVDEATTFAKKGYLNVSISYRLSRDGCNGAGIANGSCAGGIADAQHDAQAAVRFLRRYATTYGVDKTRIAIGGTSAGAITALNVGANSEDPGDSGNPGFLSSVRAAVSLSGAKIGGAPQSAGDAPSLMFHGTNDPLVPYAWAEATYNDAIAAGLISYLTTYPGEGHVPYVHRTEILDQTSNFLFWMLDLAHASV